MQCRHELNATQDREMLSKHTQNGGLRSPEFDETINLYF